MTGYVRQDTSNSISNGSVVDADDLDNEFDSLASAFNTSTGHTHDGTAAEGAPITVVGPAQEYVGGASDFSPKATSTYDLGTPSVRWATGYIDDLVVTGNVDGRDVSVDGTKLDTIETNADVTDTANVTAAGALMDSELTSITAIKALDQGVATTDTPTFANAFISGRDVSVDGTKLDTIETNADVTDTSNVAAAGALMDNTPGTLTVDSSSAALRITQTGLGNALVVEDTASPDSTPFVVSAAGYVGIGTDTPTAALQISRISPNINLFDTDGDTDFNQTEFNVSGGDFVLSTKNSIGDFVSQDYRIDKSLSGATDHHWRIGNTEAMRIDPSRNVGIGTSTPSSKLDVNGDITVTGTVDGRDVATDGVKLDGIGVQDTATWEAGTATTESLVSAAKVAAAVAANLPNPVAGAVGSYMFARTNGTVDYAFGDTVAGSSLNPTSATYYVDVSGASGGTSFSVGPVQAGTWRCMGLYDFEARAKDNDVVLRGATLWLRIV